MAANRDSTKVTYEKFDGSSPTARTDSVVMTGAIDAHEGRNIAIIDVENDFLQSENDQMIIMRIRGKTAELLVRLNPGLYRPYIWYTKKEASMLYVQIEKALYGTYVESSPVVLSQADG